MNTYAFVMSIGFYFFIRFGKIASFVRLLFMVFSYISNFDSDGGL